MKKFASLLLALLVLASTTTLTVFAEREDKSTPLPAKSPSSSTSGSTAPKATLPKTTPKYGLEPDGSGYYDATWGWGTNATSFDFNVSPTAPGKVRKTEAKEYSITDDNGKVHKKTFNIVYEQRLVFDEYVWLQITTDPTNEYPVGLCLAIGHLTYDKLPPKVKQWHDAGAYDSVEYYPAFGVYHYSDYIPLHSAIKLGFVSRDSLTTTQKELLALAPEETFMTYNTRSKKSSEDYSVTFSTAIKAGFIKESDIPPAAYKAWKAGKYTMYYRSGHLGPFTNSQFDYQNYD